MKKKHLSIKLLLFFVLISANANCFAVVKEWKKGIVVTNANDTLVGLVAYFGGDNDWEYCYFKTDENAAQQIFSPFEIKNYLFDSGLCYKSMDIPVGKVKGRYFVRSLVEGICSLDYLSIDVTIDSTYSIYLIKNNQNNRTIRIPGDNAGFAVYKKRMASVLSPFFNHNPEMQGDLKRSNFTVNELVMLFEKYNDIICNEERCVSYAETEKVPPRFFLSARLLLRLAGAYSRFEDHVMKMEELKFNAGIEAVGTTTLLRHSDALLLNVGLGLAPLSLYIDKDYRQGAKFWGIGVTNTWALEVRWPLKRVSPLIEAGFFQTVNIMSRSNLNRVLGFPKNADLGLRDKYQKYYCGFLLSAGVNIHLNSIRTIPVRLSIYESASRRKYKYSDIRSGCYQLSIGCTFRMK